MMIFPSTGQMTVGSIIQTYGTSGILQMRPRCIRTRSHRQHDAKMLEKKRMSTELVSKYYLSQILNRARSLTSQVIFDLTRLSSISLLHSTTSYRARLALSWSVRLPSSKTIIQGSSKRALLVSLCWSSWQLREFSRHLSTSTDDDSCLC